MKLPIGILASGAGTNFEAIAGAIAEGRLDAEVRLVVCNRAAAPVLDKASARSIPTRIIEHSRYATREEFDRTVAAALAEAAVELVCMAGFDRLVTAELLGRFPGKVINIHPALLPSFRGNDAQGQAARHGVTIAGATVHIVDAQVDHGPIVIQGAVAVVPGEPVESIRKRILALEHRIYPHAIQLFAEGRIRTEGRLVVVEAREAAGSDSLISPPLPR